jgi:hypothetical protein
MEIYEEKNMVIFTINDMLKIRKYFPLNAERCRELNIESGLKPVEGSWTSYTIVDKKKLMLFKIKYGF